VEIKRNENQAVDAEKRKTSNGGAGSNNNGFLFSSLRLFLQLFFLPDGPNPATLEFTDRLEHFYSKYNPQWDSPGVKLSARGEVVPQG
jgi:hypothetical protein